MTSNESRADAERYGATFFDNLKDAAIRSAGVVVPHVMRLVRPESVVDVGCGGGLWLKAFLGCGVKRGLGVDGDYVQRDTLAIPPACFRAMDLRNPSKLDQAFDLAVSLEVAEHLPESSADALVRFLTDLAPVVLFSAAAPGQVGVNHINAQWIDYWIAKFAAFGYDAFDPIRPLVWHDERVAFYYRQNMLMYVRSDVLAGDKAGEELKAMPRANCLTLVDVDIIKHNLSGRESLKRIYCRLLGKPS
ncbi:MAG: class I SAM-dependent methyltransferase [bacterium]